MKKININLSILDMSKIAMYEYLFDPVKLKDGGEKNVDFISKECKRCYEIGELKVVQVL